MSQKNHHSIKSEIKNNLSISIPLIFSQLVYASSGFIGTALIAKLGEDALAASILVSMIWVSLSVLFFGILNSVSVLVSHQYGAKDNKGISDTMGQAFILGIFMMALMILLMLNMPYLLGWSSQSPAVISLAEKYMFSLLWCIPALVILIIFEQFLAGIGRVKIVLRISLLIVPIEIPLIYFLIFGKFGFPACGVAGIGYGFAITYTLTSILLFLYLLLNKNYQDYGIFTGVNRINVRYLKELIRIGLPMGLMHLIEVGAFTVATFWMAHFGTTYLAAHQIVMQYMGFIITIVFGMSQAVTIRVGHSVGQRDLHGIHYAVYIGMILNTACMVLIAILLIFFPERVIQLDLDIYDPKNKELVQYSSLMLSIAAFLIIFDNIRIIGFGALRGLKDTRFPMLASLISFWIIGLTVAFILAFIFYFEGKGIWWGLGIGIASGAFLVLVRLSYILKRLNLESLIKIGRV